MFFTLINDVVGTHGTQRWSKNDRQGSVLVANVSDDSSCADQLVSDPKDQDEMKLHEQEWQSDLATCQHLNTWPFLMDCKH